MRAAPRRFALAVAVVLLAGLASAGSAEARRSPEELRREYNEVVAAVDTLVRAFGGNRLDEFIREADPGDILPPGRKLVLYFWGDDEAEVFLNGYRLGATRLVPVRIEIPALYLRPNNRFQAHCWDTDRVESGFMAGLYLEDPDGALRPLLLSGQRGWVAQNGAAETIYYSHAVPDIPGAEVIWGEGLFGEVWLEAAFSAGKVRQAAGQVAFDPPEAAEEQPMDTHEALSRLVRLEKRREELQRELSFYRIREEWPRLGGAGATGATKGLSYSLGRAAALEEQASLETAAKLETWAEALPLRYSRLVLRPEQPLKGVGEATAATERESGEAAGAEDRRADYRPPPERGPGEGIRSAASASSVSVRIAQLKAKQRQRYVAWVSAVLLLGYVGVVGRRWWREYNGKGWRRWTGLP